MARHLAVMATLSLVGASGLAAAGCESLLGVDFGSARRGPPPGARDAGGVCDPIVPPVRPSNMPAAADSTGFAVVMRTVEFGDTLPDAAGGAYFDIGYDQDGVCTGRYGGGPACKPMPWVGDVVEDGPRGQDDAIALLMLNQYKVFGISAVGSYWENGNVEKGVDSPVGVIRVSAFSGLGNDDHVEVDWFAVDPLGAGRDGGLAPTFDVTDAWPVRDDGIVKAGDAGASAPTSLYRDPDAFVLQGTLVAHFPRISIPMRNTWFEIDDVVLTGAPVRDPVSGKWALNDGMVAGRGPTDGVLHAIATIAYNAFGVALCPSDQANYPKVKRFICASADLPASGKADPSAPCTASSLGWRFTTAPASLGKIVSVAPTPAFCPANADPLKDTCATEQSP